MTDRDELLGLLGECNEAIRLTELARRASELRLNRLEIIRHSIDGALFSSPEWDVPQEVIDFIRND